MGFYLNLDKDKRKEGKPKEVETSPKTETEKINERIKQRGYAPIRSETLGIDIYWAKDENVARRLPKNAVVFTLEELKGLKGISKEDLKMYTLTKIFNGAEVSVEDYESFFGEKVSKTQ